MCLGAIYWARARRLVFACTRADAAAIGFDDDRIYRELERPHAARELETGSLLRDEALEAFRDWSATPDRREY
jgi:tRNA(Arg) A34 adenosine deaminase TadA